MFLHKFQNEFALKGLNKCLCVDTSYFDFPNICLKSNISKPISTKPISYKSISTDTIRSNLIRS